MIGYKNSTSSIDSFQENLLIPSKCYIPKYSPKITSGFFPKEQVQNIIDSLINKDIDFDLVDNLIVHLESLGLFFILENNQFFEKITQVFQSHENTHFETLTKLSKLAVKGSVKLRFEAKNVSFL
jgi:hypothetical protein